MMRKFIWIVSASANRMYSKLCPNSIGHPTKESEWLTTLVQMVENQQVTTDNIEPIFVSQIAQNYRGVIHQRKQNDADHNTDQRKFDREYNRTEVAFGTFAKL